MNLTQRVLALRRIGREQALNEAAVLARLAIECGEKDAVVPSYIWCPECRRTNAHNSRCSRRKA